MAIQYGREYLLSINDNEQIRVLSELKIQFEITKSLRGYPNTAKFVIYNTSKETEALLQNDEVKLTLNAGYKNNIKLLFTGQLRNITQGRQGADRIITIYAADGRKDWETAFYNKTLSDTVDVESVVKDIAKTFTATPVGELLGLTKPADKLMGQTLSGSSKDMMDQLSEDYGFQWSIQDGEFVTVPNDDAIGKDDVILITPSTGMLGTPTITREGATVKTLLNGDITPNRLIKIESEGTVVSFGNLFFENIKETSAQGIYKVYELIHKGDTRGQEWSTESKGFAFNG